MGKFSTFITADKNIYKVCPNCRCDIETQMKHAYENEWCPFCGLNHDKVFNSNKK